METTKKYRCEFICPNPIKDNGWWQLMRNSDNAILFAGSFEALQNEIQNRGIADNLYFA